MDLEYEVFKKFCPFLHSQPFQGAPAQSDCASAHFRRFLHCQPFPYKPRYVILKVRYQLEFSYTFLKPSLSSSHVSPGNLDFRVRSRSPTAPARIFAKIEIIWRHTRARERCFEECIAILQLISDLLYYIPGCIWEWLTVQKPAKMRAGAVGLCGRTLKWRLS